MQSPEYPDLLWVTPKSWTNANRTSVQLIVIHTTEGHERADSAEAGAAYDARRTDGTSTHYFHDQNSTVQCVRTEDQAHTARRQGNRRGIQHELCGRAGQGASGWADAASQGTLRQAAKQCARDAKKWDIPVRKLTVSQVASGQRGFCGHVDITYAFPQDEGSHTDPGPTFPWVQFLDMVREEMEEPMRPEDFDKIRSIIREEVKTAVGGLLKETALTGPDKKPDGTKSTPVGEAAWRQGILNPFRGGQRSLAYLVVQDLAEAVKGMTDGATPPTA
jgi:hypothetical protein